MLKLIIAFYAKNINNCSCKYFPTTKTLWACKRYKRAYSETVSFRNGILYLHSDRRTTRSRCGLPSVLLEIRKPLNSFNERQGVSETIIKHVFSWLISQKCVERESGFWITRSSCFTVLLHFAYKENITRWQVPGAVTEDELPRIRVKEKLHSIVQNSLLLRVELNYKPKFASGPY